MINTNFLKDSIDIYKEEEVRTETGFISECSLFLENIPASLGCAETKVQISQCMAKKTLMRDICLEIAPDIDIGCFDADVIIKITMNGCYIGEFRVESILPIRMFDDTLYSYNLIATQINGKNSVD